MKRRPSHYHYSYQQQRPVSPPSEDYGRQSALLGGQEERRR